MTTGRFTAIISLALILMLSVTGFGATYYVAMTGSDSNDGSSGSPWATLQHAVDTITAGDTILVKPGTYIGCRMRYSGTAAGLKTLKAETAGTVTINAKGPLNPRNSVLQICDDNFGATPVDYWVIDGLIVTNSQRYGIDPQQANHLTVKNCTVHNSAVTGINSSFGDYVLIENNVSYSNSEHGCYTNNSADHGIVRGNTWYSNVGLGHHMNGDIACQPGDGIMSDWLVEKNISYNNVNGYDADGVETTIWRNNVAYNNSSKGLQMTGGDGAGDGAVTSRNNKIYNNTFVCPASGFLPFNISYNYPSTPAPVGNKLFNNIFYTYATGSLRGSIEVVTAGLPGFESDYNIVMGNFCLDDGATTKSFAQWQAVGYDLHSKYVAQGTDTTIFVNPTARDYHLKAGSPAIDAGTSLAEVTEDFDGKARPINGVYDIGAFEYGTAIVPAATPVFDPAAGSYLSSVDVTISSATAGAEVRYTTDGSTPTGTSTLYAGAIHVTSTTTIKAKAFAAGFDASQTATATYTVSNTIAAPTFTPAAGTYNTNLDITITSTNGADIYYTTNGSAPSSSSTLYTAPVHITADTTLKAIGTYTGLSDSAISTAVYRIDKQAPATSGVATVPTSVRQGIDTSITITALADDSSTGGLNITAAECYTSAATPAGSGTAMGAADGSFSSSTESVTGTLDPSSWATGQKTIYVRARDAAGNWSTPASITINVISSVPPAAVGNLAATVDNSYTSADVTVTASSTLPASPASNLSDGSALSCWQSAGTATPQEEWVMADLGQVKSVGAVSLVAGTLPKYFPSVFVIEVSENGTDWLAVAKADRAKAAAKARYIWEFIPQDARYVRVRGLSTGGRTGSLYYWQLGEIEVPTSLSSSRLNLTWTAVADDGTTGQPAMEYDIRYSSVAISAANFAAATPVTGAPAPGTPGTVETATVDLGSYVGRVFVAMKVKDASENYSALSNVVTLRVGGIRIVSSYPDDGYNATAGSLPMFSFATGGDLKPVILTFASTDGFPATPIIMADKTKKYTMKLGTALGATSLKVSAAQWKAIKATATQGDVVFWRLEGKAKVNGATATIYGPTRGMYFDIGTILGLTVAGAHTVDGKDALYPALTPLPQFSWTNNSKGMVKFFVDVSTDPDVPLSDRKATAVLGGKGVTGTSYTLTAADWKRVRKLAGGTPDGVIYWRARGVDRDNVLDCGSAIRPLLIDSGTWTVSDMAQPAESGVVSWTTTATGLVKFYVEFSSQADFPILTKQTVRVPLAGVAGTSYTLTAADVARITSLAANNGVTTLYYRVRAEDADKSFVGHSQAKTTTAP